VQAVGVFGVEETIDYQVHSSELWNYVSLSTPDRKRTNVI
jgi:metal-dependent HD superfamily phosphatase/phosphodiesterase